MSLENQGVFQLLKEVTFRGILTFCKSWKGWLSCAPDGMVGLVQKRPIDLLFIVTIQTASRLSRIGLGVVTRFQLMSGQRVSRLRMR